jgi:3-deoxy-7-phosphoheptulonate synthase
MDSRRRPAPLGRMLAQRLPTPDALRALFPNPPHVEAFVAQARDATRALLHGRDERRLLVVVGPCSIHDPSGALEYAVRLRNLADSLSNELLVVMRTFLEKPRTALGWKGYLNDPALDGSHDIGRGLRGARQLLRRINALGVPCASELLDPLLAPYFDDQLSWGVIGARTSESAVHRQLASAAPFPVGFKNGTDGRLDAAVHAMRTARAFHAFPAVGADGRVRVQRTAGNPDGHLVLRGGRSGPGFDVASLERAFTHVRDFGVVRPLLVDCSHDNSGRDPRRQPLVARAVVDAWRTGAPGVLGLMLESYLEPGRQDVTPRVPPRPGLSVTDACLGWNETADLLCELAEAVKITRG